MIRFRREMPLEGPQKEKHIIYPWSMSATRAFNRKELGRLRDEEPGALAETLLPSGKEVQIRALTELVAHGVPRKAATVARALTAEHSELTTLIKRQLKEAFGDKVARMLLEQNLDSIPGSPKEFPRDKVTYVQ